jgi:hypothetical protein
MIKAGKDILPENGNLCSGNGVAKSAFWRSGPGLSPGPLDGLLNRH